ncbi:calcyclin-binding protein, putative [Plasmodium yoelii]|uniref:Calcyclin-binding protein, putative n=1 Tax=Plasmodium yoelii TaxID=5861 RepID=A0A077Y3Y5_PLAYE|nr:calcyclin-binding protein, putative [Plasmodium yoelii]CDU17733.1 calcyclin binding protein, putative [Plasmodium yoelii]VTZ77746.1 calcyclin-binding protein, putative [Plasmodium yoelii]|eukprot:XP_022812053.1 calcyclin-binding protein, putative [Plasmodium yoelii]
MDNNTILETFTNTDLEKLNDLKSSKTVTDQKIRYDWSQTNNLVFFTIYQKNVQKNDFLYYIQSDHISLIIKISETEIYFIEKSIFSKIIPSKTIINITPMKIELSLEKNIKELKWDMLEKKTNNDITEKDENILNPFAGKSVQEWAKFAQSIGEDEDNQSIDHFFRKIYEDGDDDLKRAMIKSFQTSNGTVLSTNWKDVQNKNYEKEKNNKLSK